MPQLRKLSAFGKEPFEMNKDPVCGMPADEKSPLRSLFERQTYRFCSLDCQAKFVREPARYAVQAGERKQQRSQA